MRDALYIHDQLALINFSAFYPQTTDEILSHDSFRYFLDTYLTRLSKSDPDTYHWLVQAEPQSKALPKIIRFLKLMMVLDMKEIDSPYLKDIPKLTSLIEDAYNVWRTLQRCSFIKVSSSMSGQVANFIDADTRYNSLVLSLYRGVQEKLQGHKNRVYRQLQAGTNASMVLRDIKWPLIEGYECLKGIPFAESILLRTPLLLHPKGTKRYGSFQPTDVDPFKGLEMDREQWFCYPAKVGQLLIFIYVHYDFTFSGISNANLFELADRDEVLKRKPDGIMLFGLRDGSEETVYHYDKKQAIWSAKVSYSPKIEYFGYMKKMVLTLHNAIMMQKGWLPIHGSMINIHFKNQAPIGVVFMGDSGAGKSETIEAMQMLGHQDLQGMDVIFDDMGSFHLEDGKLVAQGTEIGAFIRLDDLDKGSPYKTMDRSIFMNPESVNARVVIPVASYAEITKNHPIDYFFYANNYVNETGLKIVPHAKEIKQVFVEGKRMAMATTHETGLSTTYFANPFGPMQNQAQCDPLIDLYFEALDTCGVKTGEIYTGLGVKDAAEDHLSQTAKALLELLHPTK